MPCDDVLSEKKVMCARWIAFYPLAKYRKDQVFDGDPSLLLCAVSDIK